MSASDTAPSLPLASAHRHLSRFFGVIATPQRQFLVLATIGAIILLALIPPLAGGNETNNFQRVAAIAAFHPLIEPASVPEGTQRLLDEANAQFPEGAKPPFRYSGAEFRALAKVPLSAYRRVTVRPNPIAVLNPVAYVPQVIAYWLGEAAGWPPLVLFYLGRLAGAVAGIGLTFLAIARMPFHRSSLAALALLPTILFSRSTLDADQVTNGLAFFLTASLFAAMVGRGRIAWRSIAVLAAAAFLMAQCKSAYLVLLPLAFAIPQDRFGSRRRWLAGMALIVIPGIVASIGWMIAVKITYFAGIHYRTWAGNVFPDAQMARILADPLSYVLVLFRTMVASKFVPMAMLGFVGIFGPPVEMPPVFYILVLGALYFVLTGEGHTGDMHVPQRVRWIAFGAFVGGTILILTLLYVQWDGLGAPIVEGFQGRYLYPLAAPLLVFLPARAPAKHLGLDASGWVGLLGLVSLFGTVLVTWTTYWS